MRSLICIALLLVITTSAAGQETTKPPLRCEVEVCPKEIRYGDVIFIAITVTNQTDTPLEVGRSYHNQLDYNKKCSGPTFNLFSGNEWMLAYLSGDQYFRWEGGGFKYPGYPSSGGGFAMPIRQELAQGESLELAFTPLWIPRYEYTDVYHDTEKFKQVVESGETEFTLKGPKALPGFPFYLHYLRNVLPQEDGKIKRNLPMDQIFSSNSNQLQIEPRSGEELQLLKRWYLEIPEFDKFPLMLGTFAHPYHCRDSIFLASPKEYKNPKALGWRRINIPKEKKLHFYESLKNRTPESLERVARVKELEKQLLERADQPDSTISPTMKEVIILRGYLVDLRYAENSKEQRKLFDDLLDWIADSEHPELWVKFMRRIVLDDFHHTYVLLPNDFADYREKLDERFAE